jgi:WD40 repeat protein
MTTTAVNTTGTAAASDLGALATKEEWHNLATGSGGGLGAETGGRKMTMNNTESGGNSQLTADSDGQAVTAPCKKDLEQLLLEKRRECEIQMVYKEGLRQDGSRAASASTWRPRGVLVAHLTEHKGSVTGLVAVPETTLLASTSTDGTLRIWDCTKMEGRNIANKVIILLLVSNLQY